MRIVLYLVAMLTVNSCVSQEQISVIDSSRQFSKGNYNSYEVQIPEARLKDIQKDWPAYLKQVNKDKVLSANGEYTAANCMCQNVSPSPLTIYSKLLENNTGVRLTAWFAEDSAKYISASANMDRHTGASKFVRDFAVAEYKKVVQVQVNQNQVKQRQIESKLKGNIKVEDKSLKKISECKRYIDRANNDIAHNEDQQKIKQSAIDAQRQVVETTNTSSNDATVQKDEQKKLNNLQADFRKLRRQNERMHKDIDKWEQQIRDSERSIQQSKKDQASTSNLLDQQKQIVKSLQDKYEAIK